MNASYDAPAKINLWLHVFAPDHSGYHPLDTLFCAIDLRDELTVAPAAELTLTVRGADVGPVEQNLVWRAAQGYAALIGQPARVHFTLRKRIPAGAGLGGGSSDAAAALRALQDQHEHALPQADLLALAARIGSDVPFFLCNAALAHARGRGELLQPLPALRPRSVLIVRPDFGIATRAAYQWLDESEQCAPPAAPQGAPRDWQDVQQRAHNTFESAIYARYPQLAAARSELRAAGADIALLSGSGSALFGVFRDDAAARAAQRSMILPAGWRSYLTKTRTD